MAFTDEIRGGGRQVACTLESLDQKIDPSSGEVEEETPDFIQSGDAAVIPVRPQKPLSIEPSSEIPELGSFAISDLGQTVAAGMNQIHREHLSYGGAESS